EIFLLILHLLWRFLQSFVDENGRPWRAARYKSLLAEFESACRSKSAGATRGFVEIRRPLNFRSDDLLDNQLTNLTSGRQANRFVAGVIEQTTNLTTVVRINHAREHIQTVLRRESRSRRHSSIKPVGYRHRQPRPRHHPLL